MSEEAEYSENDIKEMVEMKRKQALMKKINAEVLVRKDELDYLIKWAESDKESAKKDFESNKKFYDKINLKWDDIENGMGKNF